MVGFWAGVVGFWAGVGPKQSQNKDEATPKYTRNTPEISYVGFWAGVGPKQSRNKREISPT